MCGEFDQLRDILPVFSVQTDLLPSKAWKARPRNLEKICNSKPPISTQIWAVTDDGKLVRENWEKEELACVQHVDHRVVAWTCPSPSARVSCQEVEQQQQADSTKHQKIGHMNDSGAHLQCEDRILPHYLLLVDSICIWISLGALIITFLVYAILPMFHNLHGHIVRMNIISMVFFNVSLLVVFHATHHVSEGICMMVGFFTYFSSIAMFSWMTVMCFDLHQTFTRAKMTSTLSSSQRKVLYNTIGWGLPFLLSFLLGVVQFAASGDSGLHPSIGKDHCFLGEGQPRVIFFHVPVLLLMACNSFLFAWMVRSILITKVAIRAANTTPSFMHDKREHLALYLKLYVVLGLLWGLEGVRALIVHFVVQKHEDGTFTFYFFLIVDMLNLLRGLFILLIFVCKRKVWQHITGYRFGERFPCQGTNIPRSQTTATITCEQTTGV